MEGLAVVVGVSRVGDVTDGIVVDDDEEEVEEAGLSGLSIVLDSVTLFDGDLPMPEVVEEEGVMRLGDEEVHGVVARSSAASVPELYNAEMEGPMFDCHGSTTSSRLYKEEQMNTYKE